jgi:hypothetical protein
MRDRILLSAAHSQNKSFLRAATGRPRFFQLDGGAFRGGISKLSLFSGKMAVVSLAKGCQLVLQ